MYKEVYYVRDPETWRALFSAQALDSVNPFAQAYAFLKSLPEYAKASDVLQAVPVVNKR